MLSTQLSGANATSLSASLQCGLLLQIHFFLIQNCSQSGKRRASHAGSQQREASIHSSLPLVCVCVYIYIHTHTRVCVCVTHTYTHIYTHIHVCVCHVYLILNTSFILVSFISILPFPVGKLLTCWSTEYIRSRSPHPPFFL